MVADELARATDKDRRAARAPRPLCRVPDGRGGAVEARVCWHSGAGHRPARFAGWGGARMTGTTSRSSASNAGDGRGATCEWPDCAPHGFNEPPARIFVFRAGHRTGCTGGISLDLRFRRRHCHRRECKWEIPDNYSRIDQFCINGRGQANSLARRRKMNSVTASWIVDAIPGWFHQAPRGRQYGRLNPLSYASVP